MIPDTEYVADELVAVHAFGPGGPITSSPNGDWCYAAEGGAVACVHADPKAPNSQDHYDVPDWRMEVGSRGVTAIEMVLDPRMDWSEPIDTGDPFALMYIAAGRDGLWAMDASPVGFTQPPTGGAGSHKAYRIDDSGNLVVTTQYSRKWCNDVKVLDIGGESYLLALFARVNTSRLRAYRLNDVRSQVVGGGSETGNELVPEINVLLGANPGAAGDAYAFGMAVDENEPDASHAMVYVAMGEHGIYRVTLEKLPGQNLQTVTGIAVVHGPYFGTGSAYETNGYGVDSSGRSLYESVDYYDLANGNPSTLDFTHSPYFLDVAIEDRGVGEHRVYAAVDHLGWCAFDLGSGTSWDTDIWSGPAGGTGYPDMVQEGKRFQVGGTVPAESQAKDRIRLFDDPSQNAHDQQTYARHLEFVTVTDGQGAEHGALVVSVSNRPFVLDPGRMNEGRVLDARLNLGPIDRDNYTADAFGHQPAVLVYDVDGIGTSWTPHTQNALDDDYVGWELHVASEPEDEELRFFTSGIADMALLDEPQTNSYTGQPVKPFFANHNLFGEFWDAGSWPPTFSLADRRIRGRFYRPGRLTLAFGPSAIDPDLMVTSNNDGVTLEDGAVVADLVQGDFSADFGSLGYVQNPHGRTVPHEENRNLVFGEIMDPRGGFVGEFPAGAQHEYRLGFYDTLVYDDPGSSTYRFAYRWKATKFTPSYDTVTGFIDGVTEDWRLYLTPPANKFSPGSIGSASADDQMIWSGRPYYACVSTFEDYNQYVATTFGTIPGGELEGETGYVFASVNGSPQGLWAIRMTTFQSQLDIPLAPTDGLLNTAAGITADIQGALVTHPEYWNVDDVRMTNLNPHIDAEYFIQMTEHKLPDVQTWYCDMFQLPAPGGDMAWVLAVACGYSALSELKGVFGPHTNWYPDDEFKEVSAAPGFHNMMVRLFDLSNPTLIDAVNPGGQFEFNMDSPSLPGYTIIGPDPDTSANFAKGIRATDSQGIEHYYLLVTELGGRMYLYEIGDLLSTPLSGNHTGHAAALHYGGFFATSNDPAVATYQTQSSLSDGHPNGIYGSAIHGGPSGEDPERIRIYLSVPRVGIEVLKLEFDQNDAPYFDYLGIIQTPGDGGSLQYVEYSGSPPYDRPYLYAADYEGGLRIYKH